MTMRLKERPKIEPTLGGPVLVITDTDLTELDADAQQLLRQIVETADHPAVSRTYVRMTVRRPKPSLTTYVFRGYVGASIGSLPWERSGCNPEENARQRLDRSLHYLHTQGLSADGDVETKADLRTILTETRRTKYTAVVLISRSRPRWLRYRLRHSLSIPVHTLGGA
jgi:hypothetical protein